MGNLFTRLKGRFSRSLAKDKAIEPRFEAVSRFIWPWPELRLVFMVCSLAVLDFVSTYAGLKLSQKADVFERGLISGWAIRMGGFAGLFLVNLSIIVAILLVAFGARFFYNKIGFKGLGRAAFVVVLLPYVIVATGVVFSNVIISLV